MFDYDLYDVLIEKVTEYKTPSGTTIYYSDEPRSRIKVPGVAERRYIKTLCFTISQVSQIETELELKCDRNIIMCV
jgi:hypothetical protein